MEVPHLEDQDASAGVLDTRLHRMTVNFAELQ